MEIKEVRASVVSPLEAGVYKTRQAVKKETPATQASVANEPAPVSWQKNILMDAISQLENSIQMDNSHPLDKQSSAPIETFSEALVELSFIKTQQFRDEAAQAQGNINVQDILPLFAD